MKHYLYRTTNKLNGKYYVGVHTTDRKFGTDGYIGSGTLLRKSINKNGKHNFMCEVVTTCRTREEVSELEALIVDEEFIKRSDTYNLRTGGDNGFISPSIVRTVEHNRKIGEANRGRVYSAETKAKLSANCGNPNPIEHFLGRPIRRSEFKKTLLRKGFCFENYTEIDTGCRKNGNRLFIYSLGENNELKNTYRPKV